MPSNSSPQDFPASLFPMQDAAPEPMTTATSGQRLLPLLNGTSPMSRFSKMLLASPRWHSQCRGLSWTTKCVMEKQRFTITSEKNTASLRVSVTTSKPQVMTSSRLLFRLSVSMPSTSATASGLWRSPDTGQGGTSGLLKNGKTHRENGQPIQVRLCDQVATPLMWPTPTVTGNHNRKGLSEKSGDGLATAVKNGYLMPTPTACEAPNKRANTHGPKSLTEVAQTDWQAGQLWPTPRVGGEEKATSIINRLGPSRAAKSSLLAATQMFPTPTARDGKGANDLERTKAKIANGQRGHMGQLPNYIRVSENAASGQLNPRFVEWLMGYPDGWTELKPLVTASYHRSFANSSYGFWPR